MPVVGGEEPRALGAQRRVLGRGERRVGGEHCAGRVAFSVLLRWGLGRIGWNLAAGAVLSRNDCLGDGGLGLTTANSPWRVVNRNVSRLLAGQLLPGHADDHHTGRESQPGLES